MSDTNNTIAIKETLESGAPAATRDVVEVADAPPPSLAGFFVDTPKGAILSANRQYRYFLWRTLDPINRAVNFIGLNPSIADERTDDATIRKCIAYAKAWGFGALFMTNIYAFRSTDPKALKDIGYAEAIGRANDLWINAVARESGLIVLCWGKHGGDRGREMLSRLSNHACHLGLNNDGSPKHPLYLKGDLRPTSFKDTSEPRTSDSATQNVP